MGVSQHLRARLTAWLDSSVGNRMVVLGVTAATVMVLLFGLMAFSVLSYQSWNNYRKSAQGNLERIAESYEFRLSSVLQDFHSLARNSFLINSLIDSTGREVYLYPTLRDFRLSIGIEARTVLYDANIAAISTNTAGPVSWAMLMSDLPAKAFKLGQGQVAAQRLNGDEVLAMAVPVYYPPSASYEGVLLGLVRISDVLASPSHFLDPGECLSISTPLTGVLASYQCAAKPSGLRLVRNLKLVRPGGALIDMELTYYTPWGQLVRQLGTALFIYLLIGGITVFGAYLFSQRAGNQFARQLAQLSRASRSIMMNPSAKASVDWGRPDEIGRFAEDFNTMVARLQEFQLSLEDRIRERTQELVQARDAAQAASLAKSNFLASMSHELRTPMNAVLGFSQLIELDAKGAQAEQIREVLAAGHHMLTLIDEILDLARIEAGRTSVNLASVALDGVLSECCSVVMPQVSASQLELRLEDLGPPDCRVRADRVRLKQVLINLLSNAIKYNRPGGRIQLSARRLSDQKIRLQVSDDGQGIAPERQPHLFEAFNRLGRETGNIKGTGIGLVISKKLVEMMGGEIGFESRLNDGSDFWIDLPIASDEDVAD